MAYCSKCGAALVDRAKFCSECGALVKSDDKDDDNDGHRDYAGKNIKCPNCGETLPSFSKNCPACGREIRGIDSIHSVYEFSKKLENITDSEQRASLISNYPIPNSKEDIFEFMILASSNLKVEKRQNIFDAWMVKFDQCYQKADFTFGKDIDFQRIQDVYDQTNKQIQVNKTLASAKNLSDAVSRNKSSIPNIIVAIGWIVSVLIFCCMSRIESEYVLFGIIDLIVGAFFIPRIAIVDTHIPKTIIVSGLAVSVILLIFLCRVTVECSLMLITDIICSASIFIKIFKGRL